MAERKYSMQQSVQNDLQICINSFERLKSGGIGIADDCVEQTCKNALRYINELETKLADVAPVKHGHWESNEYFAGIHMTRCSECKTEFYIQDLEEISVDGFVNYCPDCGAKMDGGDNNGNVQR